ncbi:MAG TPA: LysM peptidoglycan-binding domain-containing protein [Streptosporangiaceae bacterium]|nr:LysM peptidoglycan-binding domain-containing protein [Streptosporangiaceae bacterium]
MDYRTRSGDTMSGIAERFGISLSALEAANPQIPNPDLIFPNELIHVPGAAAPGPGPEPVPPAVMTYVVRAGDTMASIAAAHSLTLAALEAANPQVTNPNLIHPGDVLNLVGGNGEIKPSVSSAAALSIGAVTYARYQGGGSIDGWITAACHALGVPAARWLPGYVTLCGRESSLAPNAINRHDLNAHGPLQSDGYPLHCSRGVAQCIPDTFAAYHEARTSTDIYDPVANIAASMRYVMARYGVAPDGSNLIARVQQADITRKPHGY